MKIFVSSTVRDLFDLRYEVYELLKQLYFDPQLSDQPDSEFIVDGRSSTLEICLQNVRDSDIVLVILSNRYGSIIKEGKYEGISYTHAEYREAIKSKKIIHVFARNTLLADYNAYSDNPNSHMNWIMKDNTNIFNIISEHNNIDSEEGEKWIDSYTSSVDLKSTISSRLDSISGIAKLTRLQQQGSLPVVRGVLVDNNCSMSNLTLTLRLTFENMCKSPLINGQLRVQCRSEIYNIPGLPAGKSAPVSISWNMEELRSEKAIDKESTARIKYWLSYDVMEGIRIEDEYLATYNERNKVTRPNFEFLSRRILGSSKFRLLSTEE